MKLDHIAIPVSDLAASRRWYVDKLGLSVEFEIPERRTVAVKDPHDFTIFLKETQGLHPASTVAMWFEVDDVRTSFADLSPRGVVFTHGPQKAFWGFGTEAADPDGHLIRLWDARSMKEES